MNYTFHPEAVNELVNSIRYYEEHQPKLGLKFLEEVYSSILRITEFPTSYPMYSKNTRKCLTSKFPYSVIYQIRKEEIFIVAITHLARKPGYWKDRPTKS